MKEITSSELKRMRDEGEDFQLIDVREEYEFDSANIGGDLIPMGNIPDQLENISTEKPVVVVCKSGTRSGNIVRFLEAKGFTNVINLKGGVFGWIDEIDPSMSKY